MNHRPRFIDHLVLALLLLTPAVVFSVATRVPASAAAMEQVVMETPADSTAAIAVYP